MVTINISLNKELMQIVNKEMKAKKYANRSEFFRDLIRRNYVINQDVEVIAANDPDIAVLRESKKTANLVDFDEFKKNV